MLPVKLKTFHDDLMVCIRQSAEVFASLFSILFGKSGADISFYQSTTTLALLCQAQVQVQTSFQ